MGEDHIFGGGGDAIAEVMGRGSKTKNLADEGKILSMEGNSGFQRNRQAARRFNHTVNRVDNGAKPDTSVDFSQNIFRNFYT